MASVIQPKPREESARRLAELAAPFGPRVENLVDRLVKNLAFRRIPSSINKHHAWIGGNLQHTVEVTELALATADVSARHGRPLDRVTLFIAAIFHDFGKTQTYICEGSKWYKRAGYSKSLHISASMEAAREAMAAEFTPEEIERVVDCIGSHHGQIEYGALWEPRTPEAWALHLADMASVFVLNDRPAGP